MFARSCMYTALLLAPALFLIGCSTSSGLDSVQVSPNALALTVGQTAQLTATGTFGNASHASTQNVTSTVTWASSVPSVATVSASGVVTAVGAGSTSITANATAFNGPVSANTSVTVTGSGGAPSTGGTLLSLEIIPSTITVGNLQDTGQFLAIGTYSIAPFVRDVTNSVNTTWISSVPSVFPVNSNTQGTIGATAGIVTAYGSGGGVITVEAKNPTDGTIQTATANFNCPLVLPTPTTAGSCYPGSQAAALLATITVYNEGLNTSNWLVTAPSATGTPNVIDCGPGATPNSSICVATYPIGTTVTLTAPKQSGVAFGGWSYNCTPTAAINATGPNSCTVTLTTNDTVGAIFN